ncbi:branched-chain-amino-acid aminotransferase 5 chloroplast precursor [Dunaliella salina]|uniref:Branched-chain-amino-acid aminotransferase n=1 Tax=Dunaliella salina TaxID=3046 RepID=A0ABQ7H527_DUNSA|nr:branched-chain-amino-acid aminotransferase 5 chloroplast precursor [Dunaliella salina]|eukprot:KAF5841958.1 branched-chain-amino-acid aminotransferase 5 chloroplast precursor [Dunaliella salina]
MSFTGMTLRSIFARSSERLKLYDMMQGVQRSRVSSAHVSSERTHTPMALSLRGQQKRPIRAMASVTEGRPAVKIDWDKLGFGLDNVASVSAMASSLCAARLSMPPVPEQQFVGAVKDMVAANNDFVPPHGKGSLYIRPLLLGSGPILGLGPAPEYTFTIYAAAVGSYFKGGQLTPIDLIVEERFHRAAPGGMGGTKAAGNYSPVLVTQLEAKKAGYADVVYLDAKTDQYLEEVSSCNVFSVKGKIIKTPPLQGTILPGVTRRSIIELARLRGYTVLEEPISIQEAMESDEVFTTGTAVVVSSVGSLTYKGQRRTYAVDGQPGKTTLEMYQALTDIQQERSQDTQGWVVPV